MWTLLLCSGRVERPLLSSRVRRDATHSRDFPRGAARRDAIRSRGLSSPLLSSRRSLSRRARLVPETRGDSSAPSATRTQLACSCWLPDLHSSPLLSSPLLSSSLSCSRPLCPPPPLPSPLLSSLHSRCVALCDSATDSREAQRSRLPTC